MFLYRSLGCFFRAWKLQGFTPKDPEGFLVSVFISFNSRNMAGMRPILSFGLIILGLLEGLVTTKK